MTQNRGVDIEEGGGGGGYVCGVIPMRTDIGGMPVEEVNRKGAQPGQALQTVHIQEL